MEKGMEKEKNILMVNFYVEIQIKKKIIKLDA